MTILREAYLTGKNYHYIEFQRACAEAEKNNPICFDDSYPVRYRHRKYFNPVGKKIEKPIIKKPVKQKKQSKKKTNQQKIRKAKKHYNLKYKDEKNIHDMYFIDGISQQDIAKVFDIPPHFVRKALGLS